MSAGAKLPTTLPEWEGALVDRFLRIGECGDASPIRSFEVTGDTLASAFPRAGANAGAAEEAFRISIRSDRHVFEAFRSGSPHMASTSRPNCFAYLCASLLIDTLLDGDYSDKGEYRERLRTWLGTSLTMMQLPGIASMWRDLAGWLDARVAAGDPFRSLVLPDPRTWTQIGYTRRLSFPTRSDVRFLERALANFPRGASDPPGLIRAIEAAIGRDGASWGLESAFGEFRDAFRQGGASTSHRFWRLVLRASEARPGADAPIVGTTLDIEFDEDGRPGVRLDGSPMPSLGAAMRATPIARSANLASATQRGAVFFRQTGMARWTAEAEPSPGRARVGLAPTHATIARGLAAEFTPSGDWLLSAEALAQSTVDDLLSRLRLTRLRRERLIDVAVEGGVHTGSGMLGRRRFLPRVAAAGRRSAIRTLPGRNGLPPPARCVEGQIVAEADLDGTYELSVSSSRAADGAEWTRRIRFSPDATPHRDLGEAAERDAIMAEWVEAVTPETGRHRAREAAVVAEPSFIPEGWDEEPSGISDLLEAIYAAGRSGLGDAEMIDLVSRAGAPAPPWDVLRAVQESGFATARRRARWRGRAWTLEPPRLVAVAGATLLEGAICSALQEEFRQVAAAAGGIPFRRRPLSDWSPPVVGATGLDPEAVSIALGWPIVAAPELRASQGRLEISDLSAVDHVPASSWDWDLRRFVTSGARPADVTITRWVHPGGRDHDQFRVRSSAGETRHATRAAAILEGHASAGIPLFEVRDRLVARTAAEGAFPVEVARRLRTFALSGAGPLTGGGYAYPFEAAALAALDAALPGLVANLPRPVRDLPDDANLRAAISRARRDGGRTRLRRGPHGVLAA